jgi:hypothetical protein
VRVVCPALTSPVRHWASELDGGRAKQRNPGQSTADCCSGYEVAAVVSNDSDLVLPITIVRKQLRLPVGVLKPGERRRYAVELMQAATFYKPIRQGVLPASQFPPQLTDADGTITKPSKW